MKNDMYFSHIPIDSVVIKKAQTTLSTYELRISAFSVQPFMEKTENLLP